MPDPKENKSQNRGKYTNRACEECRRRRAKCDGAKPSCSRCLRWQVPCQYSIAEDCRRPASRKYVNQLRQRIESLERLLDRHGIDSSEVTGCDQQPFPNGGALDSGQSDSAIDEITERFQGRLALDDDLSNLDQDGEMRYFGPTSGRLQFQDVSAKKQSEGDSAFPLPASTLESLKPMHPVDQITAETGFSKSSQDHFLGLYFTWEQPWFAVVDETLFRQSMDHGGRYWSLLLHYCILAVGSRYSGCIDARSGKVFFEQAKRHLCTDIERPSLTTLQAVTIMGTFYIAMGSDATGWLYHGMAHRLSLDMGLNLDPAGFEETNILSHREVQLRRQIYWTLYCHDKWSSSYTGRICSMLDSQAAVKMPEVGEVSDTASAAQKAFIPLQRAMIKLCLIQEKIILSLWAPKPLLNTNQRPSFLTTCLIDLGSWFYDLPTELRIDRPDSIPHAYTLYMIYHTARVLLARPFIMKKDSQQQQTSTIEQTETTHQALSISRQSAREICLVAQKYRQAFGSFELSPISATHCTLTAALVLLDETGSLDSHSHKNKLSFCLVVLGELSKVWYPARHIRENLRKLCFRATSDEMFGSISHSDDNAALAPLDLGVGVPETLDEVQYQHMELNRETLLANDLGLMLPTDSLPFDYGLFDILNQDLSGSMW